MENKKGEPIRNTGPIYNASGGTFMDYLFNQIIHRYPKIKSSFTPEDSAYYGRITLTPVYREYAQRDHGLKDLYFEKQCSILEKDK